MQVIVHDTDFLYQLASYGLFEMAISMDMTILTTDFAISGLDYVQSSTVEPWIKNESLFVKSFDNQQITDIIAILQRYQDSISITNASLIYLAYRCEESILITKEKPIIDICIKENVEVKDYLWFFKHFDSAGFGEGQKLSPA